MKKTQLAAILLLSGIWGLSEAFLGESLYAARVPGASIYLTAIAFFVLAAGRSFLPRLGGATAVGLLAMLYKFLNAPFFACHLTGIAMMGLSWDVAFGLFGGDARTGSPAAARRAAASLASWRPSVLAAAACYLGHVLFAGSMIYLFRSGHWVDRGVSGGLRHVFVTGSITAAACAVLVPIGLRLGSTLRHLGRSRVHAPASRSVLATALPSLVAAGIWGYGVITRMLRG